MPSDSFAAAIQGQPPASATRSGSSVLGLILTLAFAPSCAPGQTGAKTSATKSVSDPETVQTPQPDIKPSAATPQDEAVPSKKAYQPRDEDRVTPHQPLEFPDSLSAFLAALTQLDGGAQRRVRVVHIGASMLGDDDFDLRAPRKFQRRFGDGGAGLVLLQRYMSNYRHNWVSLKSKGWKNCFISYGCRKDGRYGLGGATFSSTGGARTTISTRDAELGRNRLSLRALVRQRTQGW